MIVEFQKFLTPPAFVLLAFCTTLAAGDSTTVSTAVYRVSEPSGMAYLVRMLASPGFLRLDAGDDDGDFTLMDRKKRLIFHVAHERRNVLVIPFRSSDKPALGPFLISNTRISQQGAPKVGGRLPIHSTIMVDGRHCRDVIAVPGLLPDLVAAMREFRIALATEHARVLRITPADVRETCDTALNVAHPTEQLVGGLPMLIWDGAGKRHDLQNYVESQSVSPKLFVLPGAYSQYVVGSH